LQLKISAKIQSRALHGEMATPIEQLREVCLKRGVNGIRMIGRWVKGFVDRVKMTLMMMLLTVMIIATVLVL